MTVADVAMLPPGADYQPDFLTADQEAWLVRKIDQQPWNGDLQRRVQHYGYRYSYRARAVTHDSYLGPLPDWVTELSRTLVTNNWFSRCPDQMIVNEYLPGQGISAHVDCVPCFGNSIVSISLLSPCEMIFRERGSRERRSVGLEPRSALWLSGAARFEWTHEIPARKSDRTGDARIVRSRRLSLTFRTVEFR